MDTLPVDIWLLILDFIENTDTLWSNIRNVSRYLRECVDEHFRYATLRDTLIELQYSDINRHEGPEFSMICIPMRFSYCSEDGTRAIYTRAGARDTRGARRYRMSGSLAGWVPFIERCCEETSKPKPTLSGVIRHGQTLPVWETAHVTMRNKLVGPEKARYLDILRSHTSIGRGDRPPYFLKIDEQVHDTELVDLAIDCKEESISLDWRRTLSAFFQERHFVALAILGLQTTPSHDRDMDLMLARGPHWTGYNYDNTLRARRRRLQPWIAKNKHRMTHEHRLTVEGEVQAEIQNVSRFLNKQNLRVLRSNEPAVDAEYVPGHCAEDHPDLWLWPYSGVDSFFTPKRTPNRKPKHCVVM